MLDPKLAALEQRLLAAIAQDALVLDAAVLGADGQRIVDAMANGLSTDSLSMSSNVTVEATADTVTLSADQLDSTVAGITTNAVFATFGLAEAGLSAQILLDCGAGWSPPVSFPALSSSWAETIAFVAEVDNDAQLVLATDSGVMPGSPGQRVAAGLNLRGKLSVAEGPATGLAQLAAGVVGPLPVIGPAHVEIERQDFAAMGVFPDFTLSLPILPTLSFRSPYAGATAAIGPGLASPTYAASVLAGADVSVGTDNPISLPLVVEVPDGGGWKLGLALGRVVPLPDLAAFLGDFTGLGFVSALPSQVTALSKLALNGLTVQLTHARDGIQSLNLSIESIPGSEDQNLWTIIPGSGGAPLLALSGIAFQLQVRNTSSGYDVTGSIEGRFQLSSMLQLSATVPIPAGTSPWTVTCMSTAPLPNLNDFAQYLGGQQLSNLLPSQLGALTSYQLNALTFVYDPQLSLFTRLALDIQSTAPWTIVNDWVEIFDVQAQVSLDRPSGGESAVTGTVSGVIRLAEALEIVVTVSRGAPQAPWYLDIVTEEVALPSLGAITMLCGGDISSALPATLLDNHFSIRDLALNIDISARQVRTFAFELSTTDSWPIIADVLVVSEAGVFLQLDWAAGSRQVTGTIWGNIVFCQAGFWLQATKETDGWVLAVSLDEGAQLTLQNLVTGFDASLWSTLQSLGVPDVALTSASATYLTATGSYAFAGTIAPADGATWRIDVGIGSLSIKKIGAAVTCTRASDGTATDKKVHVTGKLAIGTVEFDIDYLAGGDLTIDCVLVGSDPVSLSDIAQSLCGPASAGTWVTGFPALDKIFIQNASARIVLGSAPKFQLGGQFLLEGTLVSTILLVEKVVPVDNVDPSWEFAFGVQLQMNWSLPGFTSAFAGFKLDQQTWTVIGSNFSKASFAFPPGFATPAITGLSKGLNFYGTLSPANTLPTISGVIATLPAGTVPASLLTVHGLLTDPIADSFLEVMLVASADGVPLMGWDTVRLAQIALRLTPAPSFVLHGDFILRSIKNPDGSVLHVIMDLAVSFTEVQIIFEQQPNQGAIFTWQDAFGLPQLDIALLDLALGILFEGPAFDGTIGGSVAFEHRTDPVNSVRKNELPAPHIVVMMEARRQARARVWPERYGQRAGLDYGRRIDQDGIHVEMHVSFVIFAEEPAPVPYKLAGRFINFTLPYILKRFVDIDIPSLLMPIQFPDVAFAFELPNPLKGGSKQLLNFMFNGDIEIYGLLGHVEAQFDQGHIRFMASMQPLTFKLGDSVIVQIARSGTDLANGPQLQIDSAPPAGGSQISGAFFCNFFDGFVTFDGAIKLTVDPFDPAKSSFFFEYSGHVGSLAQLHLKLVYSQLNYMAVDGSFFLGLTTNNIPGFSKQGVVVADGVDLSKYNGGLGVVLAGAVTIVLDASHPAAPSFTMHVAGSFEIDLGSGCQIPLHLAFKMEVNKDSMADIPSQVTHQLLTNTAAIFDALIATAQCYVKLLELGLVVLEDAMKVARVLADIFETGIDVGATLLKGLGNGANAVAKALWNIFGSNDSEANTKAMKDAGYDSDETGAAVKEAADQGGHPYRPQDLVRDQAAAGYGAGQVLGGLCIAFTSYASQPVAAGVLLANAQLTSFGIGQVAQALRGGYPARTENARDMYDLLAQVFDGSSTPSAQQMANALAPLYPAVDVAKVLRNHYPDQTATGAAMTTLLLTAYANSGTPLSADALAGALAPLYHATATAAALRANFPADTDTATKLATLLKTAYAATSTPLTAAAMAAALGGSFATPADLVPALQLLYPVDTDTAGKMAALLLGAYPAMTVSQMASALVAGKYPRQDIASVLMADFPDQAGSAVGMAQVLATAAYTPAEVAPVLKVLFPADTVTAAAMLDVLQQGFAPAPIAASLMATALAAAPFTPVDAAPALKGAYPVDVATATQMALLLATAFDGTQAPDAATMAQALARAPYAADGDAGTAKALISQYPAATTHAIDMAKLLKQAPYPCAEVGPALKNSYPTETVHAADMASLFAQAPFDVVSAAPTLKTLYPAELETSETMYALLATPYPGTPAQAMASVLAASSYPMAQVAPTLRNHYPDRTGTADAMYALLLAAFVPAPSVAGMAGALAASPYLATQVAPVLKAHYPTKAGSASQLVALLRAAYAQPEIALADMLAALAASSFNAYEMAPAVQPAFLPTAQVLGTSLAIAMSAMPPSATQLGAAFTAANYAVDDLARGVKAGVPSTSAGLMAAVLLLSTDATTLPALAAAAARKAAGDGLLATAPKVVAAVPAVTSGVLAAVLDAVFGPPNLALADVVAVLPGAYAQPSAASMAQGALTAFPVTTAGDLLAALTHAFQAAGKALDAATAAAAVADAFQFIGTPLAQVDYALMLVRALGAAATPAEVASSLVAAYASAATAATIVPALVSGFSGTTVLLDARVATAAVQGALGLSETQADQVVTPVGQAFQLTRCPNDVGVLAVALKAAGFTLNSSGAALSAYFGGTWTPQGFAVVASVYAKPMWVTALAQRVAGATSSAAAVAVYAADAPDAAAMVQVLAGTYDLNVTAAAISPMAQALKGVTSGSGKAYTETAASAAMSAQYSPDWTPADWARFIAVFNS